MVAHVRSYYGDLFTGSRGVTQGNPLSTTIFNMMVEAIIRHWETRVEREDTGTKGFGRVVQKLAALFYVYRKPWTL